MPYFQASPSGSKINSLISQIRKNKIIKELEQKVDTGPSSPSSKRSTDAETIEILSTAKAFGATKTPSSKMSVSSPISSSHELGGGTCATDTGTPYQGDHKTSTDKIEIKDEENYETEENIKNENLIITNNDEFIHLDIGGTL